MLTLLLASEEIVGYYRFFYNRVAVEQHDYWRF